MSTITASPIRGLSDEQRDFQTAIRDFAERECGTAEQREKLSNNYEELHNQEIYEKLGELGWLGVSIDEEYGGAGAGMVDACIFLEETMRGLVPIAGYGVSLIVAGAYERFGNEAQKQAMLGGICKGRVEAIAMSEPGAGSDVGSLSCKAERTDDDGGGYVLNGQKTWISAAHLADHILVIARSDDSGSKHDGLTMLSVPTDAEGVEIRGIQTLGGKEVNDVFLTDCHIPEDQVLGEAGGGWMQLMAGLNVERLILAATALGIAQRAFDDVLDYIKERQQFGRPIGSFQVLKHRIAELATELEATRLLVYDVAAKVDEDPARMLPREASMAKLKATELAKQVALDGMQMMGGYGYASEYDMERHVRATLVMSIYGGTNEIQREIVSKTYGL
jgi:alkylation response protein AidB-like acyl-CoA dehydrogenase